MIFYYGKLIHGSCIEGSKWLLASERLHKIGDIVVTYDSSTGFMIHEITNLLPNDHPATIATTAYTCVYDIYTLKDLCE